jgi:heptosyltransferase-1
MRLSALGDVIHALPLLAALRERWPGAFIGWLVEPGAAPILQGHPMIDRLHVVPKKELKSAFWKALRGPGRALVDEIKAQGYGVALDVQGLTKSAAWAWLAGIPRRIGLARPDARELAPTLATESVVPRPGVLHVVERNLELLRPLGLEPPRPPRFPVYLPDPSRARAIALLGEDPTPLAVLVCGAGWATKRWPTERFGLLARALAERHGCRVALSWGPDEAPLAAEAMRAAGAAGRPDFAAATLPPGPGIAPLPATSFLELGAILEKARLVVGGDTGPTHLAAALGAPVVAMMGPLDARRNGPYGERCRTIQHGVPRRAPWWRNHRAWSDPATRMEGISVEEALEACAAALEGA